MSLSYEGTHRTLQTVVIALAVASQSRDLGNPLWTSVSASEDAVGQSELVTSNGRLNSL